MNCTTDNPPPTGRDFVARRPATGFPRHCHFLATVPGDMRALGQEIGMQVYKKLWDESERGWQPVAVDLALFKSLNRYPYQIQRILDRFLTSDPVHPILVLQKGQWWLRGLPADPAALEQEDYLRQRVALTLSALGPLSQRQLYARARINAAAVRKAGLQPWQQKWEQGCPKVPQVMQLIVVGKYNPGLAAPQLAAAIQQLGPAFCLAWTTALPQLDFIEDRAAWLRKLLTQRGNLHLPWLAGTSSIKNRARSTENHASSTRNRARSTRNRDLAIYTSIKKGLNIPEESEGMASRARVPGPAAPDAMPCPDLTEDFSEIKQKLKSWLLDPERRYPFDVAGVESLVHGLTDPELLSWKVRHLQIWIAERQAQGDWRPQNPPGLILRSLAEFAAAGSDQLKIFADAYSGDLPESEWPGLPWEDLVSRALAQLDPADAAHLTQILHTCGVDDPQQGEVLFALRLADGYGLLLQRLLGRGALESLWATPRELWRVEYLGPWYAAQVRSDPAPGAH